MLNLNSLTITSDSTPKKSPSTNFDLLSGLGDNSEGFADFVAPKSNNINVPNAPQNNVFDPFGRADDQNNLLGGWNNTNNGTQAQKPNDFFADLGNLGKD